MVTIKDYGTINGVFKQVEIATIPPITAGFHDDENMLETMEKMRINIPRDLLLTLGGIDEKGNYNNPLIRNFSEEMSNIFIRREEVEIPVKNLNSEEDGKMRIYLPPGSREGSVWKVEITRTKSILGFNYISRETLVEGKQAIYPIIQQVMNGEHKKWNIADES